MGAWKSRALGIAVLLAAFATVALARETQTFDAAGLQVLRIKNLSGDISIVAHESPQVVVTAGKRDFTDACTLTIKRDGEALLVRVEKASGASARCGVEFDIRVPKEVSIDAASGSGDVNVQATTGRLTFKTGSGDVMARGAFSEVTGASGSGDIKVVGLAGNGGVRAGSGDVWIDFVTAPPPGALEVRAGSGDVEVRMPTGTKISARLVSETGRVRNKLGDDASAEYFVSVQAGSGNVRLTSN